MKKIISFFLIALIISCLCACGNNTNNTDISESSVQEIETEINTVFEDDTTTNEQETASEIREISLNEEFNVGDIMTISLNSSEWCNDILPSDTSGGYLYKKGEDGEMYFVVRGTLKNLATEEFNIQYSSTGEMLVNEKYKVPITLELEENSGTSFSASVKPLQTLNLIVYGSVSEELYNAYETAKLTFSIVNTEENLSYYYNDGFSHDTFSISFGK